MSYVEDKRGVPRGSCACGQCAQYVPQPEGHACGYCGCLPVKHEDLRKTSNLQESFPIFGTKTEIASEDELPVIYGPGRPRKSKYLPDRSDAKDWTSEQETARLSGTKTHSGLGSVKTNKIPGVSLAHDSQVPGSFITPQYQNSDTLKKVPPCELLQTSHMPYYELPNKHPMRGVFKIAYKHKTIYIGKSLNIRRHLKRLMPGRIRQEIGKFLRNLPKKKMKHLTVSWIDSDVHEHNCNGKSYFRCITKLQGEKPKYSYPKRYTEDGGGAAAVPTAIVSTHGITGMITTADKDCHIEMGDVVPHKSSGSPTHSCFIGVDPRQVKKKRSESPQQSHSNLTGASQGRSKKFLGSGNLLKKKNDDVSERDKMTVFESDVHKVESEGGKLASLKGTCQMNHKKPKTTAANLLSKALQTKSTKHLTNAPAALGTKEHTTKTKSCSVLLNKKIYYIPEADVKKAPSEHLEKKTSETGECPGVERVKALSSLKKILHVPSAEETRVTKSSKVTVLKSKTSTRYMDTTMSPAPGQGSFEVSGEEYHLTDIILNTSTPIPVIPTEEKNELESICKEEISHKEYSSLGIPFTEEDNQEWIPDILADSEDAMKLIIDEQQCTYSPDTSKDAYENLPESPMAPLKMEHDYKNEVFRSDSKHRPEEDDASVPASPENKEGNPESTPPISTQWVSMSPVRYQHPTKASATDSLRTQSVPMMSQIPHSFVEKNGTFMSESSDLSHSINSCSVTNSRPEGSTDGTTQSSSTDERVSPGTLPRKHHATNLPIAVDDTKPVKEFWGNTALDCTTKCPEGRNSRCDTRIVVCDQRSESCSPPTQYRKRPYVQRESWPMFDNIEHWRSHQHLFKSYSYSRCYTRREQTSGRVEAHHVNVKDTALVKIERPAGP
ncbi:uncharacterized protein LOC124283497 [Haliotis rubra]|uniref:uncharacterized protein LOC124283497 n=1 Tax=Haliotis rubra TaxID=36100 RepID=UPI001EE6018D|nr:uncharacterized protein LOC124283497 [Haliotis rubra]